MSGVVSLFMCLSKKYLLVLALNITEQFSKFSTRSSSTIDFAVDLIHCSSQIQFWGYYLMANQN